MSGDKTYRRHPDVVYREIAGERLLVPVRGEAALKRKLFSLNPLGASIWRLLEQGRGAEDLFSELEKRYPDIGSERIRKETRAFLDDLARFGLILEETRD